MVKSRFTNNKQIVRDLQGTTIKERFGERLGELRYFGLSSDEMKDIIDWNSSFSHFTAAERGDPPDCYKKQHLLMLTAFKTNIMSKLFLLRGDIDNIILAGKDDSGKPVEYPFDVISLDYSGGLFYRNDRSELYRLNAIKQVINGQSKHKIPYLLFISANLDNSKDGEVKNIFDDIKTELTRSGFNSDEVVRAYMEHDRDEARLKIYVPYFVNQVAALVNYHCETEKVIVYLGNRQTHMMNFRFFLMHNPRTTAPRFPKERLAQIFNAPMIGIMDGKSKEVSLGLPKLVRQHKD